MVRDYQVSELKRLGLSLCVYGWRIGGDGELHSQNMGEVEKQEPIPITQDFLEKNFEKKTFFGIFDDYFDLTIREYSDSLYIVDYHCCEMALPDQHVTVCFVHELQHFLTHCGIDKEIIL